MNTPTGVPTPIEERHEVLEALKAGEMTPLISLGSVDEAMTYLKKRFKNFENPRPHTDHSRRSNPH
jgi:hypothetical protein